MNRYLLFLVFMSLTGCQSNTLPDQESKPENGDLNESFLEKRSPEEQASYRKDSLLSAGWTEDSRKNGLLPPCYNFTPKYDYTLENYLAIHVGSGTDLVVKLINNQTGRCIRYVFINRSSSFKICNIPQGVYYLKLAYGKDWLSNVEDGKCIGLFLKNPVYEKGEDLLDFNIIHNPDGYSIPSYEISLDVISTSVQNSFSTTSINELEFNN